MCSCLSQKHVQQSLLAIISSTSLSLVAIVTILFHYDGFLKIFLTLFTLLICGAHHIMAIYYKKPKTALHLLMLSLWGNSLILVSNMIVY